MQIRGFFSKNPYKNKKFSFNFREKRFGIRKTGEKVTQQQKLTNGIQLSKKKILSLIILNRLKFMELRLLFLKTLIKKFMFLMLIVIIWEWI